MNSTQKYDLFDSPLDQKPPLPGYRLSKLEVYNWGTFDGSVYSVQPRGQTTLLVGENGSGKSTLIDALLTLLVRPQTRNYNVAAGAMKNERSERSYIRGAYDRTAGDGGRPQVQYLRSAQGHFSALLACFSNESIGNAFTICQVLYLTADNNVEKIYAFREGEGGIANDLGGLVSGSAISKMFKDRGYQTTSSYTQYFHWLQRLTSFRSKAMSVFNQTVAVKDVQRLDLFIQQHMLELKPWKERVASLLEHFSELSEAHRMLLRVRQQDELLRPIFEAGQRYREKVLELDEIKRRLDATGLYFATETSSLLTPLCEKWQQKVTYLGDEILRLDRLQTSLRTDIARLEVDIENAGGERLRQIPQLIEQQTQIANVKREARRRLEAQLSLAGLQPQVTSPEQFAKLRQTISERRIALVKERDEHRQQSQSVQYEIGSLTRQLTEDTTELQALLKRKNNLPEALIAMRDRMCQELQLAVSDLPFAAELVSVAVHEWEWEASIEQVLHGFARSLLVSSNFYAKVAGYVERTRLQDGRGAGQRLVYLRIGQREMRASGVEAPMLKQASDRDSLLKKLEFRDGHALTPWVRAEIAHRFDYQACDTVEQFQMSRGPAMTRNRHLKSGSLKHEKDDRSAIGDRRTFVLGWDNRAKRQALSESIRVAQVSLDQLQRRSAELDSRIDRASAALEALDQALRIEHFENVDHEQHEFQIAQLQLEKQKLESSNDQVRELKLNRDRLIAEAEGYRKDRDQHIADKTLAERELSDGRRLLGIASGLITLAQKDGLYEISQVQFDRIRQDLGKELSIENLSTLPSQFTQRLREEYEKKQDRLQPVSRELTSAMTRFLKKFPEEQADLDSDVQSLESFEALYQRISRDDLPKHEQRFKSRLNEKVLHEVGLLHGRLENDRQEIRDKIEQLNSALKRLEWKPGTYMQLEPTDTTDREIQDFRRELAGCLSGTLDGTPEANEATFLKIEKLVTKLRDDGNERWRQKVIDVRNWFNFAAREIVAETGESRSYYDGGAGQSGGEKGKLAFLVLVAAIAYQYDIDPDEPKSKRFHFVMVDEMFSRSDDQHAEYALDLFERFGLQLLIVAPLDAKARVTEPYVGTYLHVVKNKETHRSELLQITSDDITT